MVHDDIVVPPERLVFDEAYYRNGFGAEAYQRTPRWTEFFDGVADEIVRTLKPTTLLDAGCAMGMLVESLRARGVDAQGVDISDYAISQVPRELEPFCRVGSITEPLEGRFDIVTCIEVLEHIPPQDSQLALHALTQVSDTILFSSTPDAFEEPSHVNIRPVREWLALFADLGFQPDISYDAGFVCAHAFLVRRRSDPLEKAVVDLFAQHLTLRAGIGRRKKQDSTHSTNGAGRSVKEFGWEPDYDALQDELLFTKNRAAMLQAHSDSVFASPGWRIISGYRSWLHSYIWPRKRLRALYEPLAQSLLDRLSRGWRATPSVESPSQPSGARRGVPAGDPLAADQQIRLCWDGPTDNQRVRGLVELWGWAAAASGIRTVEATIDDETPLPVEYGLPRPDALKHLPTLPRDLKPGFRVWWDTTICQPGTHTVRILAESAQGRISLERTFLVDQRDEYEVWQLLNEPSYAHKQAMRQQIGTFAKRPTISLLTPVFRSDLEHLAFCISSVRSQIYPNWELCLVDDGSGDSRLTEYLETVARQDARIRVTTLETNRGIAGATNAALKMATGEFVALLDHDDTIADSALFEVVKALNSDTEPDVIYSDEDKLDEAGERFFPFFKPDWSPDLLRSCNYVCHFLVARKSLLEETGGLRSEFDGSQDYDLILRLTERTDRIHHIPKILYHWRTSDRSAASRPEAKPKASEAGARALSEHLKRCEITAAVHEVGASRYRVRVRGSRNPFESVSSSRPGAISPS